MLNNYNKLNNFKLKNEHWLIVGLLLGLILIATARFVMFPTDEVHTHANFAVNIKGQNEEFDSFVYYEETTACNLDDHSSPAQRTHMHEPNNDLVHVHDDNVTWQNFFESLGWVVGSKTIEARTETYIANDDNKIIFILNGEQVQSLVSRVINDGDKLLVSFGNSLSDANATFSSIESTASEYNEISDPAACAGSKSTGLIDRLQYSIGL